MTQEIRNINTIVDQKLCMMGNDLTLELRLGYKSRNCSRANLLKYKIASARLITLRDDSYKETKLQTIKTLINAL